MRTKQKYAFLNFQRCAVVLFSLAFLLTISGCSKQQPEEIRVVDTDKFGIEHIKPIIDEPILLPDGAKAQQGIMSHPDGWYFMTANTYEEGKFISTIYKVDTNFSAVAKKFTIVNGDLPLWEDVDSYRSHMGQAAYNPEDGLIYVSFMDTTSNKTALLAFDKDLNFQTWYDWSTISPYLDAIAFDGNLIWFDYGVLSHLYYEALFTNSPGLGWIKYDYANILMNTAQGITIKDGKLYHVPENDVETKQTLKSYRGVAVYDIDKLVSRPAEGPRVINYPQQLYQFEIPVDIGDHEAMDFVHGDDTTFVISSAKGEGDTIYKVKIKETK